jgi:PAS domain S-box-containing protein
VTSGASVLLIAIGVAVLVGWALDMPLLKGLSGEITMKANTAACLVAAGIALPLVRGRGRVAVLAGQLLALLIALVGFLTLTEHLFAWDLGIDQRLFVEIPGAVATASPNRMGPNGATSLTLAGLALCCLGSATKRAVTIAQLLAAITAVLALVPIIGYIYGARELYTIARFTGIAVPTGVSLLILSVGILTARPHVGPMAALLSEASHGAMARRLLLPAIALPLGLGYLRVVGERYGLYDAGLGAAMFATIFIVLLFVTIWRTAVALETTHGALRSVEDALTETEHRFRSLADQAPVMIWVEEANSRIWFNKRWFEFTGAPVEDLAWRERVHPDDLADYDRTWLAAARSNTSYSHQYRVRRADGQYAWVLETATPRLPAHGAHSYVGSCIDISELRQAQQDRDELLIRERTAREKAERADRAKDEFIAALSHELRTPLNAILGWMHMLQEGTLPNASRDKATSAVARNAGVLARLIEDLLDTSRIATGHLDLSCATLDMATVVNAAVESTLPAARAKKVEVMLTVDRSVPQVFGDAQRLQQVVWNLLSNAIKFSAEGGRIRVRLWSDTDAVMVSVRDEGEGIDPAALPQVFERFQQVDASPLRAQTGLGLGLYIARHITHLHGGRLTAHSDGPGRGAEFTMRIPMTAADLVPAHHGRQTDAARDLPPHPA